MDILTLANQKTQLKRTAATHGGEWTGPCPGCGGRDRFHVWPDKADSKRSERIGIYWCRSCGKSGDVVQFLVDFDGKSYSEAFQALGMAAPGREKDDYSTPRPPVASSCTSKPIETAKNDVPPLPQSYTWSEKVAKLVEHAEAKLKNNAFALKWLKKRGISKKTAAGMRLGWLSEDRFRARSLWGLPEQLKDDGTPKKLWIPAGLVIPMMGHGGNIIRIRIRRWSDREPRYYVMPGSSMVCMAHGLPARSAVIVESELDAVMLAGIASDLAAVVALGSATAKPGRDLQAALADCAVVLVALDADRAGAEAMRWWRDALPRSKRWPVPSGKDPGEAFAAGVDIRQWIEAGLPRGFVLGPSPRGLVTGRAAECELKAEVGSWKAEEKNDGKAAETDGGSAHTAGDRPSAGVADSMGPAGTISALEELAGLLRKHPVEIRVAPDGSRVHIRENQNWKAKNWDTAKRISELVFQDCEVLDYLLNHGSEIITGKNILSGE